MLDDAVFIVASGCVVALRVRTIREPRESAAGGRREQNGLTWLAQCGVVGNQPFRPESTQSARKLRLSGCHFVYYLEKAQSTCGSLSSFQNGLSCLEDRSSSCESFYCRAQLNARRRTQGALRSQLSEPRLYILGVAADDPHVFGQLSKLVQPTRILVAAGGFLVIVRALV